VARRRVFDTQGGTIGRAPGNDWVLADPYVSGRHAAIEFREGEFFIEDLNSRNGVFVNGQRLESGTPSALQAGDLVFIEPYEMLASLANGAGHVDVANRSAGPAAVRGESGGAPGHEFQGFELDEADSQEWLDRLGGEGPAQEAPSIASFSSVSRDPLDEAFTSSPPRPARAVAPLIPDDYDPLADSDPDIFARDSVFAGQAARGAEPGRVEARQRGEASSAGAAGTVDLRALLAGAGLQGVAISPEVAGQLGQILRVVVEGLLDVLKSRQEIKDEFRIRHTVMKRHGNNPLKFAVDVEDALHNLLVKKNPGYLGPVTAFEDAFSDVRLHQMAMLAGVRDAFEHMFAQFHPDRLQRDFNRHTPKKGGLPMLQSKPDYWEFYRDFVQRLASNPDGSFRTLFGDEFAKAYERQLDALKGEAQARNEQGVGRERKRHDRTT
jgi:type VI secretion system FHA domain protein